MIGSSLPLRERLSAPWLRRLGRWVGIGSADDERAAADDVTGPLCGRVPVIGVVGANVLAGLLFGPAYGSALPRAVWVPVVAIAVALYICFEVGRAWAPFEQWRALVSVVLGLLAIVETTLHATTASRLPTGSSLRALYEGARRSWLLTLQSTLPAHADPQLVVFVPMLVLAAGLVSVQIVTRTTARLLALLPAVLVAGLAQAYYALSAGTAVLVVLAFALAAVAVLGKLPRLSVRVVAVVLLAAVPAVVLGAFAGAALDPVSRTAYALQNDVAAPPKPIEGDDPLTDIAGDLESPDKPLFTVRGNVGGTDRWPIVVYTNYDGANFTSTGSLRKLGSRLDIDQPTDAPVSHHHAQIAVNREGLAGPWIPSQTGLVSVSGRIAPLVYEDTGTLVLQPVTERTRYQLEYTTPKPARDQLRPTAELTPHLATSVNGLSISQKILDQARKIAGDAPPTFGTALLIETYLLKNYHLATGSQLPSGHSLASIERFLVTTKVGTSEQFASAYVLLARILGIPTRLVVGYRQPAVSRGGVYQITSHDVFAWPEVSVRGIGWVALDPTKGARSAVSRQESAITKEVNEARQKVTPPPPRTNRDPGQPRPQSLAAPPVLHGTNWWLVVLLVIAGALLLAVLGYAIGVPIAKWMRNRARRRRRGNSAIVSAWLETRDRLRDHGVDIRSDMTVRDVRGVSGALMNPPAVQAMERLGDLVDSALWAGAGAVNRYPPDVAWGAYDTVRHSLSARPIAERLVAGLTLRSLRPMP